MVTHCYHFYSRAIYRLVSELDANDSSMETNILFSTYESFWTPFHLDFENHLADEETFCYRTMRLNH
jgi:hypothetical protein